MPQPSDVIGPQDTYIASVDSTSYCDDASSAVTMTHQPRTYQASLSAAPPPLPDTTTGGDGFPGGTPQSSSFGFTQEQVLTSINEGSLVCLCVVAIFNVMKSAFHIR